ncbi:DNA N-6-adenine-methyltransferase [Furfurilactobacillus entadae]|uniref:DNA N-6-adenine-methyltransferase n=1 Tax=Furfurilactobacillus entadae TaxID=2922307 RepID=UPI0035E97AF0
MTEFYSGTALTSNKDDWETPQKMFDELNQKYNFTTDLAARSDNAKCAEFITPEQDSLSTDWTKIPGNLFLNPPYGRDLRKWVQKAYQSSLDRDGKIVLLIPSRTDTSYWHDFIFNKAKITFLRGRLKFEIGGEAGQPAPFPSAIVVYGDSND